MYGLFRCTKLTSPNNASNLLNRTQLAKLKSKAMRAGVWYKALPRIDRVLVDLSIKVAENIRSTHLAKCLLAVFGKLEGLLENSVMKNLWLLGKQLAEKLSLVAQKLGNLSAKAWATDRSFALFLATTSPSKQAAA